MDAIRQLRLAHLILEPEYRRYYPAGESIAHVVGLTDIDDIGLEGIELAFESSLRGEAGSKTVLRDREGRIVDDLDYGKAPRFGTDLQLSIKLSRLLFTLKGLKDISHSLTHGSTCCGLRCLRLPQILGEQT